MDLLNQNLQPGGSDCVQACAVAFSRTSAITEVMPAARRKPRRNEGARGVFELIVGFRE
jgi:hypothetical protein